MLPDKPEVHHFADMASICPSRSITQMAFRRRGRGPDNEDKESAFELAVASEDTSVRVYSISKLDA